MMGIAAGGENALEWNLRAIEMADHASDPLARNWLGSLLNNTGWSLYDLHRYEEALAMFERAQAFREEQLEAGRGSVDNVRIARYCVAKGLRALGRLHEALERQAALAKELLEAGKQPGYQWEEMGEALLSLGRKDEAKPYFAQAYGVLSQDPWLAANEGSRLKRLAELGSVVIEPMEG
jgi:tetratricopeptide (TPR) repeat protein